MPAWLISEIVFCAVCLVSPAILLLIAWLHNRKTISSLIIPMVAVAALALSLSPEVRAVLVGADYTRRLFVTIGVFAFLTAACAIYAMFRKLWIVAVASALVALGWMFMGVVNSVV